MPHNLSPFSSQFSPPQARHYNSALSIWLSVDPMSDKYPGVSPYTYCANNPVRLKDEDGRTYFEVEGEKKNINDGHDDITLINVTKSQYNRLQRNFNKGRTTRYNTLYNRFKKHNGYIENTTYGNDFIREDDVCVLAGIKCTRHTGEPYTYEKFFALIRKIDEGGSGDYFDRKFAEKVEPYVVGGSLFLPPVSCINNGSILATGNDMFGNKADYFDYTILVLSPWVRNNDAFEFILNAFSAYRTTKNEKKKQKKEK